MSRKQEITGLSNERDFPHLVELALPPPRVLATSKKIIPLPILLRSVIPTPF
jgi:hypothetical protein